MGTSVQPVLRDNLEDEIKVKQFFGGEKRGQCVQLTTKEDNSSRERGWKWQWITVSKSEAKRLASRLNEWADGHAAMGDAHFDE